MHARNSILVFALYLLIAIVVLLTGRLIYLENVQPWELPVSELTDTSGGGTTAFGSGGRASGVSPHVLARTNDRLTQLQQTLERTSTLLEQRTSLLHKKDAECSALRAELDESIDLVFAVLADGAGNAAVGQPRTRIEGDLKALRTELLGNSEMQLEQATQLEELRQALIDAELEIADLRMAAEQEILALATERDVVANAARDAMAELGTAAVPTLTNLLTDPRANVRAWAASALGSLGLDAAPATPALLDLLSDSDQQVRLAAQQALAAIEP